MKKHYLFGAMAMGLILGGCSSDELLEAPVSGPLETDQTFYISMSIGGDTAGSRAADENGNPVEDIDFEEGTATENGVNNAFFVFYDAAGNVVGDIVSIDLDTWEQDNTLNDYTVEKTYKSTVAVTVNEGELKPTQVLCYLNPINPALLKRSLAEIQTDARTSTYGTVGNTRYFAMSNSVYYPNAEGNNSPAGNAEPFIAAQIPETALYTTEAGAQSALNSGNTVNIYVERYATKLTFTAKQPEDYVTGTRVYDTTVATVDGSPKSTIKKVVLTFNPLYWALNAESTSTYVIKSFRQESETGEILGHNYSYSTLNSFINPSQYEDATQSWIYPLIGSDENVAVLDANNEWKWNNAVYHRSYWGMSPAYFTAEYPEVSSDLKDFKAEGKTINQKYISFTELETPGNGIGYEATDASAHYFRETTVGSKALNSKNPNAAVASVIYVGKYTLTLDGVDVPEGTSFYTYLQGPVPDDDIDETRPYIYFDGQGNNSTKSTVAGGESMLMRFLAQATILYRESVTEEEKAAGIYTRLTVTNDDDLNMLTDALEVSEISDAVKVAYDGNEATKLKLQNNARSLQFKSAEAAEGIYIVTDGGYMQIVETAEDITDPTTQITLDRANVIIMSQVGFSFYYTLGHAYFSIPVNHFGWYRKGNEQRNEDAIDWNKVRVGDFGMVRNHSYKLKIDQILGLANGIGDDDNPIVPPSIPEKYYMAYSVRILKWAVLPEQGVTIK